MSEDLMLVPGQSVGTSHMTMLDIKVLPRVRRELVRVARNHTLITYGDLRHLAGLPHPPNGIGRLLGLISADCAERGEPSLAALVINKSTGEVGDRFLGDAPAERRRVFKHWKRTSA